MLTYSDIIKFWFEEITPQQWWVKDATFDCMLTERFQATLNSAIQGELYLWRQSALGRLAEVLVLDQFSRNIYRDEARAFLADPLALALAQEAVYQGADTDMSLEQQKFIYMPFMHSESLIVHEQAVELFSKPGLEDNLAFEHKHKKIIERFGRYPHRNSILGRVSTPEELAFLTEPGSSF